MRLSKANIVAHKGEAPGRLLTALVFILAFTFQSFVAQTHIHVYGTAGLNAAASASVTGKAPDQSPQDEASKCPACQLTTAMGAAVGPLAITIALPAFAVAVHPQDLLLPARAQPAHAWTSRGPPAR